MTRVQLTGASALVAVAAAVLLPLTASAHALPQAATPAEGSTVGQAPATVSITFGESPDPGLSSITVVDSSGTDVDAGATTVAPGHPTVLQVPLKQGLGKGVYTVTWKTVSSVDGHLATGSYAFGVGVAASSLAHSAASVGATAPSVLAVVTRLLLFAGLVVVVGAVVLGAYAFGTLPLLLRRVVGAGAAMALLGTAGVVVAQASGAGIDLGQLAGSSLGRAVLARAVPALLLVVAAILLLRSRRHTAVLAGLAAASALVAMTVDVLNSHAAAQGPAALNELAQALHIAAVGVWIGGIAALLVVLRHRPEAERAHTARRLSTLAAVSLVVVAATGVFRAVVEVQTWGALVSTAFGVLVLLKAGLIVLLAALGAINRWLSIPHLPRTFTRLRRVVTTEAVVAVGALTVAAALVNIAPPVEYGAASTTGAPAAVSVDGSDYAMTVRVHLTVTPGGAGFNTFTMRVSDYGTGAPVNAQAVQLEFTQPFRPGIASSTLTLARQGDGTFTARGANLSLTGIWQVAAVIENGEASTEVHLLLTTDTPAPQVTVTRFAGLPTVYTVQVSPTVSAQVYLDPNRPGTTEFHVTFLDAQQRELTMAGCAIGETPPGGTPRLLVDRRLDPTGHFVGDATVPAGATRFDIIATTASGQAVATFLTLTPGS